jgi:hypothetical protein
LDVKFPWNLRKRAAANRKINQLLNTAADVAKCREVRDYDRVFSANWRALGLSGPYDRSNPQAIPVAPLSGLSFLGHRATDDSWNAWLEVMWNSKSNCVYDEEYPGKSQEKKEKKKKGAGEVPTLMRRLADD